MNHVILQGCECEKCDPPSHTVNPVIVPLTEDELKPRITIMHLCLSVRGALKNWSYRDFRNLFTHDDGTRATVDEAKEFLLDELAKGHEVIPMAKPCEGFDYSGAGCPGHPQE